MKFEWDKKTMKEEYDFTNAEQGRFYRPIEELEIPVYLDKDIREILMKKLKEKGNEYSLNSIVNALIKQDIEIFRKLRFRTTTFGVGN